MKRFFILFSAFTVLLSAFVAYFPATNANAVSAYDDVIELTTNLPMGESACESEVDLAQNDTNWAQVMTAGSGTFLNDDYTWDWSGSFETDLLNFWDEKTYWGVVLSPATQDILYVWYTDDPSPDVLFYTTPGGDRGLSFDINSPYRYATVNMSLFCSEPDTHVIQVSASTPLISVQPPSGNANWRIFMVAPAPSNLVFFLNFPITFPPDYEGIIPPDSAPSLESYTPEVGYHTTTNNVLNGLYIGDTGRVVPAGITEATGNVIPWLRWTTFGPDGTTILDQKTQNLGTPYSFQLPGNDTYYLEAVFANPPPPFLPIAPDTNLRSVRFEINAQGTFVIGSTSLNTCTESGSVVDCGEASPLEDCTTYGADLGGYFQCIINNFGTWLNSTLITLFVPRYSFFTAWVSDFSTFLSERLGFLYTAIGYLIAVFTGIISNASVGTCTISPPGTFFGASLVVDVCLFEEVAGETLWTLMQGVVISLTVLALAFAAYRKYLEVVDHR